MVFLLYFFNMQNKLFISIKSSLKSHLDHLTKIFQYNFVNYFIMVGKNIISLSNDQHQPNNKIVEQQVLHAVKMSWFLYVSFQNKLVVRWHKKKHEPLSDL